MHNEQDSADVHGGRRETDVDGIVLPRALIGPFFGLLLGLLSIASVWGVVVVHLGDDGGHANVEAVNTRLTRNESDIKDIRAALSELQAMRHELVGMRADVRAIKQSLTGETDE